MNDLPEILACPECGSETISCECGKCVYCPRCPFNRLSIPCECESGIASWGSKQQDDFENFADSLID